MMELNEIQKALFGISEALKLPSFDYSESYMYINKMIVMEMSKVLDVYF